MPTPDDATDPHRTLGPKHSKGSLALLSASAVLGLAMLLNSPTTPALSVAMLVGCALVVTCLEREVHRLRASVRAGEARCLREGLRASQLEERLESSEALVQALGHKIDELQNFLVQADREVTTLEGLLERALEECQCEDTGHPLFRRVGLDKDCPEFVAKAVRREYRKRLHPDTHSPERQRAATERYQEAENVFDEIWQLRGF